jgi:amino acid adenylation domain-containing protein/non-ribosomal peptide synthase protein (TIGR01720 family)
MFELLHSCVSNLNQVLAGKIKSVEAMFPGGDVSMVENVYKKNEILRIYSQLVASSIRKMIEIKLQERPSDKIRILEIGAGTGGTSAFVFEEIDSFASQLHYCYTDISGGFLQYGKSAYGKNRSYLEFKLLDVEKEVSNQNIELGSYDIVFASNVIHATKKIDATVKKAQSLLKKGGVLLLNETTKVLNFTTLTFGLADGWWLFEDESIRLPNSPLLSSTQWSQIFKENQFGEIKTFGCQLEKYEAFQHLIYGVNYLETQTQIFSKPDIPVEKKSITNRESLPKYSASAILSKVKEITKEASGIELSELKADINLFELGLDSLMLMAMKDRIEKEFSVVMDTSLFYEETDTLQKISHYIESNSSSSNVPTVSDQIISAKMPKRQVAERTSSRPHLRGFKLEKDNLTEQQLAFVNQFMVRYNNRTRQSKLYAADSKNNCADWINSLGFRITLKEIAYPVVMKECFDARFVDLDGNEYIDFAMGYGVGFFGNNIPFIKDAIQNQLNKGFELGPQNHLIGKVSELICEMTKVDRVSYCNSGTEAVMVALRLARTATKRNKIVFFSGSYHGTFDGVLAFPSQKGYGAETQVVGTPEAMMEDIMILPYGDEKSLEIIKGLGDELAGVLVEPVQSRNPSLQPKEFLQKLRSLTKDLGAVLIFDEVLLGFRICQGGAQKYFGVTADIVTYGKIVGGGMPIGVVAGTKAIMDFVDGGVWQFGDLSVPRSETTVFQGTFCKHPLAMAAAHAVLTKMKTDGPVLQEKVNQLTDNLAMQVNRFFENEKLPIKLSHFGSVFKFDTTGRLNPLLQPIEMDLFYLLLIEKGVYTWEKRICFLSLAHTQQDVDYFVQKIVETIKELKAHGFLTDFPPANKSLAKDLLENSFVASTVQKRLFSLKAFDEGKSPYQLTAAFTHQGKLNVEALENAINRVYLRHPLLRSRFEVQKDGEIFIKYRNDFQFKFSNTSSGGTNSGDKNIDTLIDQTELELDLVKGPAFKIALFEIETEKQLIVFTTHHCVIDGLSWDLFVQDLLSQLELKNSYEIKSNYENFIKWQQEYFLSEAYKKDKDYWLNQFIDELPLLELPMDYPRPARKSGKGGIVFGNIDKSMVIALKEVAKKNSCTINMLLLSVYSLFLNKLSNQNNIIIGMPISGRPHKDFETVIGMFANSIALPLQVENETSFPEFITQVKNKTLKAYQHQSYPFERLVEHVVKNRDLSRNPIFDTMFVFEKGEKRILKTSEFHFEAYPLKKDISPYDLALEMIEQNGEMSLNFEFNSDIFKWETMKQWQNYLLNLFNEVIANANLKIGEYQLWNAITQDQFLQKVNNTKMDFGSPTTLINLFDQSLQKNSNEIFTINGSVARTYQEIDELSNGVAEYLLSKNFGSTNVVVHIEKSDNYIPIIIGIMKAGACFVPVEAKFTSERLQVIAIDCQASLVIIDESLSNKIGNQQLWITPKNLLKNSKNKINLSAPHKPAYIIYTSGSTGKPKGVVVWHQTICNNMLWRAKFYQMNKNDSVLQLASYSFDSSLAEILPIMISGGSVIFFNESDRLDIDLLSNLVENHQISLITTTPSFYDAFLIYLEADGSLQLLNSLRSITLAGEETSLALLQKHQRLFPEISLVNEYGPTENSICGTVFRFENENVSIGKPIGNNKIFVWNKNNQVCPPGVLGQLVISGSGVTAGYLNRPDLTEKVFLVQNKERYYFTGDLGTWDNNGNLYFKGRIDDQVKIRGYRIELGEIKTRIDAIHAIKESVVHIFNDVNGKAIVAYFVMKPSTSIDANEIKETLLKFLPPYMVPTYFIELKEMPLNNSGKVNKKALPTPLQAETSESTNAEEAVEFEPPRDFKEIIIAQVWEQVLNHSPIGIRDNYFHLGGDSIKAIQVMGKLSAKGFIFKVPDLFENPTIAQLAKVIQLNNSSDQPSYQKSDAVGECSLTPIQKWFLNNSNVHKNHFNQSVLLEAKSSIDLSLLNQALQFVLEKHAALRSNFGLIKDQIKAIINEKAEAVAIKKVTVQNQMELTNHLNHLQEGFDLVAQPLIRFSLIQFDAKELLFITAHHLVVDVISWRIILDDISSFYQLLKENKEINTTKFYQQIPFKKWSDILKEYSVSENLLSENKFWQKVEDKIQTAKIPNEENYQSVAGFETITKQLNVELSSQLITTANKAYHTEINDLLLTALFRVSQKCFSKNNIALDVELHGRQGIDKDTPDLNQTVGWFTSMYPIYLEIADNAEIGYQIKEVKEQIRAVPNKGLGYGVLKYLSEKIVGDQTPSIALNYLGQLDDGFDNDLFILLPDTDTNNVSKHRYLDHTIELELFIQNQVLVIKTHFRTKNGLETWMNQFTETFKNELTEIINHCTKKETTELTPNDLTFKGLSVEELDNLFD